jgi:alanine racemase
MSVVLTVDGDRWRTHLRATVTAEPELVPVIKGNGYGFGNGRLARKAQWLADQGLGCRTVAVGTYPEIADVEKRYDGDLVVLTPWRRFLDGAPEALASDRILHTVGRTGDLDAIASAAPDGARPRVVLERMTSMKRHGFTARGLRRAAAEAEQAGVRLEGVSMHFPLDRSPGANLAELEALMTDVVAAGLHTEGLVVWVSHLQPDDLAAIRRHHPEVRFRPRVGTALWLGDRGALHVTARVLDLHPVERGEPFGYRGRTAPRSGTIVVVSGGTAHGIGLEAPTGDTSLRSRATSLARGGLDALGAVRSPYVVDGKQRFFAEPPHMQASMLFLPAGAAVPEIGDEVPLKVRFTATTFDRVTIT